MKPYQVNPRSITERSLKRLKTSLQELGDLGGVVFDETSGQICGGHQRLRAMFGEQAGEFCITDADIEIVKTYNPPTDQGTTAEGFITWKSGRYSFRCVAWDEQTFRRANFVANTQAGEFDWSVFANTISIQDLQSWDIDPSVWLAQLNTDAGAVRAMIEAEKVTADAEPEIDRAAELLEKWQVKTGDLWKIGEHRLLCGDSTDKTEIIRLAQGEKFDCMLTDPPYCSGGFQEAGKKSGSIGTRGEEMIANDTLSTRGYIALMKNILLFAQVGIAYIFTDWRMWINLFDVAESSGFGVRNMIVWDKGTPGMGRGWRGQHELIMAAVRVTQPFDPHKAQGNVIQCHRVGNINHPTEKPIELMQIILDVTDTAHTIYDPFAGSGVIMAACQNLGRECRAIEISPAYCSVTLQRMSDAFPGIPIERIG